MVVSGLAVILAIASFAFLRYQERAHVKFCFAQQRNLQGLIENLSAPKFNVSMDEIYVQLIRAGLITGQVIDDEHVESVQISDPGSGPGSFREYGLAPVTNMVFCNNHGSLFFEEEP